MSEYEKDRKLQDSRSYVIDPFVNNYKCKGGNMTGFTLLRVSIGCGKNNDSQSETEGKEVLVQELFDRLH